LDLFWDFATWHGYAKLRLHSDSTLLSFETATHAIGKSIRHFANVTCKAFNTVELDKEVRSRVRAAAKKQGGKPTIMTTPLKKTYQMNTYKMHALGHYAPHAIRYWGTTDGNSGQGVSFFFYVHIGSESKQGESYHRYPKRYYRRGNRNHRTYVRQIAKQERCDRIYRMYKNRQNTTKTLLESEEAEVLASSDPSKYFNISLSRRSPLLIPQLLRENRGDPAIFVSFFMYPVTD
jgi:hypothetical protein